MRHFFKEYMNYYKDYKKEIFLALLGMVLVSLATSAIAYIIKPVLDKIFIEKNSTSLYLLPLGIIAIYFTKGVGRFLQAYYVAYVGEDIVRRVRDKFLKHILTFDIDFFKKIHSGELVSRITNDINRIQNAISKELANFIRDIIMAAMLLFVVIYQSPKLALFALVILPMLIFPISKISKKVKKLSKSSQEKSADINSRLNELFSNIETIKAFNANNFEHQKFKEDNFNFFKINIKSAKTQATLSPILETLNAIVAAIIIIVGGSEVIAGSMTVGGFFSFMTALFLMTEPIKRASNTYASLQNALAANDRLKEIFNLTRTIADGKEKLESVNSIEFKDTTLKYADAVALKNINYTTNRAKIIGLVGDSGGGKSSFVSLMMRFYDTSSGEVLINGKNIKEYNIDTLRKRIAYIPQNIHIFNDTILANIAYGKEIDKEKAIDALKKANLYEFISNLEDGVDTVLQENGSNLSGGQKQRIAIARALYLEPDILLLDEATSALDNKSEASVMSTIENLKDTFIFIVAHRLTTIKNANEILVFKEGKIVCQGSKDELLANCEEFKKLYH